MLTRLLLKNFHDESVDSLLGEPKTELLHIKTIADDLALLLGREDRGQTGIICWASSGYGIAKSLSRNAELSSYLSNAPLLPPQSPKLLG